MANLDWQKDAACTNHDYDPEWWFNSPDSAGGHTAINICTSECPVRDQCAQYRQIVDTQEPKESGQAHHTPATKHATAGNDAR